MSVFAATLIFIALFVFISSAVWDDYKPYDYGTPCSCFVVPGIGGIFLHRRMSKDYSAEQVQAAALLVLQSGE